MHIRILMRGYFVMADFNTIKLKFGIKADRSGKAICHKDGPALVLAGPGSAKQRLLCPGPYFCLKQWKISMNQFLLWHLIRLPAWK